MNETKKQKDERMKAEKNNSAQEETNAAGNIQEEKIGKKLIDELDGLELGAVYTGIENLIKKTKTLDEKITQNADGMLSRVTEHFRNTISSYNKKKL